MTGIRVFTYLGVIVVGACAMVLSYHALYELGLRTTDAGPRLAIGYPVVMDGILFVGIMCHLYALIQGPRWRRWAAPKLVIVLGTVLSIGVQAGMVDEPTVLSCVVSASPPAALAI